MKQIIKKITIEYCGDGDFFWLLRGYNGAEVACQPKEGKYRSVKRAAYRLAEQLGVKVELTTDAQNALKT